MAQISVSPEATFIRRILPRRLIGVLAVPELVVAPAPVTHGDVEQPVGAKREPTSVVVGGRLVDGEKDLAAVGGGYIGVRGRPGVAGDAGVSGIVCVVDIEKAIGGVVGMEGEAEKAALAAVGCQRRDVEKRSAADDPDPAALLNDEQSGVARGGGQE